MRLISQVAPSYLPEATQTSVLRLGLVPLEFAQWMQCDSDFSQFHAHKLHAKQQFSDKVYAELPRSWSAQQEFQHHLLQHLIADHSNRYRLAAETLYYDAEGQAWSLQENNLWHMSLWVQEDICILELIEDEYRLTAASVCSPSNWRLEDKIGQTLDIIHQPVPNYQRELAQRVNRLFDNIKPHKPLLRFNWSIQIGNELLWRKDLNAEASEQEELYWRVERQTLVRLPQTQAIVFAIRIYLHSFTAMLALPAFRSNLSAILASLPAEQKQYKGIETIDNRINNYLNR